LVIEKRARTKYLFDASDIPSSSFYAMLEELEELYIAKKTVKKDRSVFYSITPFGEKLLELSIELEEELHRQKLKEKLHRQREAKRWWRSSPFVKPERTSEAGQP
jgi:predicted transcriptional regulator